MLPKTREANGGYPEGGVYTLDGSKAERVLGIKYHDLETSIRDTVASLKVLGA